MIKSNMIMSAPTRISPSLSMRGLTSTTVSSTGYNVETRTYDRSSWNYQLGADGYVKTDPTMQHPRCVYQLLKKHYSRYTPEMVEKVCGTPKEQFLKVAEMISSTAVPERSMTIMYALGWTQHSLGTQMIRTGAHGTTAPGQHWASPAAA